MNCVTLELKDSDDKTYKVDENIESPQLIINDDAISNICKKLEIKRLRQLSLKLGVNNMALIIKDYTLTDIVYIEEFYDIKSYISIFQTKDTNIHITGQTIQTLQADCKSVLLGECHIDNLQIGMFHVMEETKTVYKMDKMDLRDVTIGNLDIYAECKDINIQRCNITELNNIGNMLKDVTSTVSSLHLWQNTNIGKMSIMNVVEEFKIEDSSINRLSARAKLFIDKLIVTDSTIENCYEFKKENFKNPTYDSWQWIEKLADNARDLKKRADANYQMAKALYSTEKKGDKIVSNLFDFCAGYGYKPLRVIRTSGVIVLLNTFILTIIKVISILNIKAIPISATSICKGFEVIWKNFLIAFATLAGQISFLMEDGLPYWLSIIEYLIGVILFAMFVNALYARYKE